VDARTERRAACLASILQEGGRRGGGPMSIVLDFMADEPTIRCGEWYAGLPMSGAVGYGGGQVGASQELDHCASWPLCERRRQFAF